MLRGTLDTVRTYFSVPALDDGNGEIFQAQYEVFSRQIPLMYAILLTNAWILVASFWRDAPLWLTGLCPLVFSTISVKRLLGWWRGRQFKPDAETARNRLASTNRLALAMAVFLVTWSLALYPYGDLGQKAHIAFFMAVTGICVVVCLMHLRSAAFIVWIVISMGFFGHFIMTGEASFVAMAVNMPFVTLGLLLMVHVQANHFNNSVAARSHIEAVSKENLRLANTDNLTDLPNRRMFFTRLKEAMQIARKRGTRLAVAVIDLDGFKSVNDLYGHAAGDQVLIEVGRRLKREASEGILVSRLGGDEFAIIFENDLKDSELLDLGNQMCAQLSSSFRLSEATINLSASIGIAIYPDVADCPRTLYERADYVHYDCKRRRRGTAALFSKAQISEIEEGQRIETVLRGANHAFEIFPVYQPIVDVALVCSPKSGPLFELVPASDMELNYGQETEA